MHSAIDDHSRLAYSEILPDEKGTACGAFLARAAQYFTALGVTIERVITDNHFSYPRSNDVAATITAIGAKHIFIKPYCRTKRRSCPLAGVLQQSTPPLHHRRTAPDQPTVTNLTAQYS